MKPRKRTITVLMVLLLSLLLLPTAGAAGAPKLPDLVLDIPQDVHMNNLPNGEVQMRFATPIQNVGDGPLIVRQDRATMDAIQEIVDGDGNIVQEQVVGKIAFDPEHGHFHMLDLSVFHLRTGSPDGPIVRTTSKISTCFFDNMKISGWGNNYSQPKEYFFDDCHGTRYGLNVGWQDMYPSFLPNQWVVVTGVPDGQYYLTHGISHPTDNAYHIVEKNVNNNTNWVKVEVFNNGHNVRVIDKPSR